MIAFHDGRSRFTLEAGQTWASASSTKEIYRDTPSEELMAIVQEVTAGEPWRYCLQRHYAQTSPWLYRIVTDASRDLFFRQRPPPSASLILDIGAGWGQIARPLALENVVVAVEPTPERLAFLRAAAHQDGVGDRIAYIQSDFMDLDFENRFDLVTCIGVLEWVPKYRSGEPWSIQREFLAQVRSLLAPGGRLVIGIENRLGLKYLLGAPDDHVAEPNICVFDAPLAAAKWAAMKATTLRSFTYTRAELEALLGQAGFASLRFFAATPDYKVPEKIEPLDHGINERILRKEFIEEHNGANGAPLAFQSELRSHYRSLAELGIAHEFQPSFFIEACNH